MSEPVTPLEVIATRVRGLRNERGWTASQLAQAMTEVGVAWDHRLVVTRLEGGRRDVSVSELLALAYVLGVSPLALAIPLNDAQPSLVLPDRAEDSGTVRAWARGTAPLPGMPADVYWTNSPEGESPQQRAARISNTELEGLEQLYEQHIRTQFGELERRRRKAVDELRRVTTEQEDWLLEQVAWLVTQGQLRLRPVVDNEEQDDG